jgi:putative ABC transport system permease protein
VSPRDLLGFSLGALRGHRLRTGLSLLGVATGVAAVVTLTALGEGARVYVTNQFASLGTNLLIVAPGKNETTGMPGIGGVPHDLTLDDALAIAREVAEVEKVAPFSMGTESVSHGERRRQVAVLGSTNELLAVRRLRVSRGRYLPATEWSRGSAVAVLGATAARELFPGADPVGEIIRIGDWRMRVIGVMAPRGVQLGVNMDDVVHVPVATSMQMFNRSSLFRILIQVRAHAEMGRAREKVVGLLTERHDGEEDVTCLTQDAVLSAFSAILNALTLALAAIAAISLSVAGIGIMNVMLVSVAERTSEVGLLKALGAGRGQILLAFLAEAVLISTAGGVVGLLAGTGVVRALIALYPDLPARPPLWAVAAALALSVAVGATFGVLPARRATHLDPVAALSRR